MDQQSSPTFILVAAEARTVAANLALEEWLFDSCADQGYHGLVLYRNTPSVVGGKFQNPWQEVNCPFVAAETIPVVRRISGGGTVYHDGGNLNWSFICPKGRFDKAANLAWLQRFLADSGLPNPAVSDRGDLLVNGRKIGGNALCHRGGAVLHHGTLLIDADLARLRESLRPGWLGNWRLDGAAVRSNPMSVTQWCDWQPGSPIDEVVRLLAAAYVRDFEAENYPISADRLYTDSAVIERRLKYEDWTWNFGRTPQFQVVDQTTNAMLASVVDGCLTGTSTRFDDWLAARIRKVDL